MGQQLRRAVGKVKEAERFPSRVTADRRSLPKEEHTAAKSPSTAAVNGVSDKEKNFNLFISAFGIVNVKNQYVRLSNEDSLEALIQVLKALCVKDYVGMETFLSKWVDRMEPWATCFFPACLYMGLGYIDKSLTLFRKTGELLDDDCRKNMYGALMRVYCQHGDREDVYLLSNLAKRHGISFDTTVSPEIIKFFAMKNDFDGAHEIMEEWDTGAGDLRLSDFGHRIRCMKEEADKAINMLGKKWESLTVMLQQNLAEGDDDGENERRRRVTEALEGRRLHDLWNPKTSMTLFAYACVQYVEGRRDMESAAEILKLLNKQEQVSRAMDKDRLCLKMVEAMRGGGYVGGEH